jgi:hypothetical protein
MRLRTAGRRRKPVEGKAVVGGTSDMVKLLSEKG